MQWQEARVAPISNSVIGGMLLLKTVEKHACDYAIANRTYDL